MLGKVNPKSDGWKFNPTFRQHPMKAPAISPQLPTTGQDHSITHHHTCQDLNPLFSASGLTHTPVQPGVPEKDKLTERMPL